VTPQKRPRVARLKRPPRAALALARRLFPQARALLRGYPDVIGVSVGLREQGGAETGEAAFVVTVRRKRKRVKAAELIPSEVLGVPVDVQQSPLPTLKSAVAGGALVRPDASVDPGHLGFMATDGNGRHYAVTAMHVLVNEVDKQVFPFAGGPYFPVEVDMGEGFEQIGRLQAGEFNRDADVACIRLSAIHPAVPTLLGTDYGLGEPADPSLVSLNSTATLVIPEGPGEVRATLVHYPYDGAFACDAGVLHFHDLLKFHVAAPEIVSGWSGSLIFRAQTQQPLALLSFGTNEPDDNGKIYAFGFPLQAHYAAWGLQPL
jgi:hypothetical protein